MMVNLSWLKIVPYLAVAGAIWWAWDAIYTQGREFEIAKCESRQAKADMDSAENLEKLRAELEAKRDLVDRRATQIIGAYANEIEKLSTDLADAADHRLYITAKAANCKADRDAAPVSDESSGSNGGEIRFEIQETLAREISGDYYAAAGLEIKFNTLADLIKSRPDCFEIVR